MKTASTDLRHTSFRLVATLGGLALLSLGACRKPDAPESQRDSAPLSDTVPTSGAALTEALKATSTALAEKGQQDTASPRLSIARIDSALQAYDGGDTLRDTTTGTNECNGEPIQEVVLRNGLKLSGSLYNLYAYEWTFSGKFQPVLGLQAGMDSAQVLQLLGRPRLRTPNAYRYISAPPEEREADLFEARWSLDLLFEKGKLKVMTFIPSFDDC
jgi:hypothetical protein